MPPPDLPLNLSKPKPTPQQCDQVIDYLVRQGCDRPGPLTEWLVKRENNYFATVQSRDLRLICYAAARDAACWQLKRTEVELLELFAGFDECTTTARDTQLE